MRSRKRDLIGCGLCLALAVVSLAVPQVSLSQSSGSVAPPASLSPGRAKLDRGQYQEAAKLLEQAIKEAPDNASAHRYLGEAYLKQKKLTAARDHLRQAIRKGKGSADAQAANELLLSMPADLTAPKTGPASRMIAAVLGLFFRDRGMTVGEGAKPVVMEFYAPWAQSCKMMKPVIERAKSAYGDQVNFVSVNVDDPDNEQVVDQYGISPVPTVIFINPEGEVVSYSIGFAGEQMVEKGIKGVLKG